MSEKSSKKFYTHIARPYSWFSKFFFRKNYNTILKEVLLLEPKTLLDVGSGPGDFLQKISLHIDIKLAAQDISEKMIKIAKEKIPNLDTRVGSASNLLFENNIFDVVTNMLSFHHYEKPDDAVSEMYRVLNSGGHALILDICPTKFWRPKYNIFGLAIGDGHRTFYTPEEMKKFMIDAGFKNITQTKITRSILITKGEK